ncbi:MAG TPA: hypothetical protein VF406_18050 [Thermodesulfobacteriota bacterium]
MPSLVVRRWLAGALVPLLVGMPAAAPAAAPTPPVALLVVPAPDLSPRVARDLRERIVAGADGLAIVAGPRRPEVSRAAVEALREGLDAGRAAYEALDADTARARFEAVTAALEADPRLAAAAPDLLDAPVLLGVVALGLGDAALAERAFERALHLAPGLALPPGRYAPAVEHALATARVRLTAVRPTRLHLSAVPIGADLFVDGVHRGRTPLAMEPLAPGPHAVVAQSPLGTPTALTIDANEFGPDVVEVVVPAGAVGPSLVALARSLSAADARPDIAPGAAAALADALGADRLALVWVEGTPAGLAAAAALVDLATGDTEALLALVESPDAVAAGRRVGAWLAAAARGEAPRPRPRLVAAWRSSTLPPLAVAPTAVGARAGLDAPTSGSGAAARDRWYHKWYWWALIGVGVVAGAAAVAAADGGGGGERTGSVTVGP